MLTWEQTWWLLSGSDPETVWGPVGPSQGPENPNGMSQSAAEAPEVGQPGSQGECVPQTNDSSLDIPFLHSVFWGGCVFRLNKSPDLQPLWNRTWPLAREGRPVTWTWPCLYPTEWNRTSTSSPFPWIHGVVLRPPLCSAWSTCPVVFKFIMGFLAHPFNVPSCFYTEWSKHHMSPISSLQFLTGVLSEVPWALRAEHTADRGHSRACGAEVSVPNPRSSQSFSWVGNWLSIFNFAQPHTYIYLPNWSLWT